MADDAAGGIAGLDFASVSPAEFAKIVKGLSAQEIDEIMRGELRERILGEIFGRMKQQFRPDSAGSLDATIRWKVTGESDAYFETTIADGACTVREGKDESREPRTTLIMADAEFLKLVSGNSSPVTMFMMRKVKVAGDVALASGLTRYFDIPKA
ncbi:SCP2 sterol-binding domain-containing protein [Streptomyces sp. NPDC050504]|uniref:SCP2 sterol-binding domain-containing protein n=1 Tax=Streptomyces sp. NPDC050504 TaxID=3365618 RepID=UPI0037A461AF